MERTHCRKGLDQNGWLLLAAARNGLVSHRGRRLNPARVATRSVISAGHRHELTREHGRQIAGCSSAVCGWTAPGWALQVKAMAQFWHLTSSAFGCYCRAKLPQTSCPYGCISIVGGQVPCTQPAPLIARGMALVQGPGGALGIAACHDNLRPSFLVKLGRADHTAK